MPAFVSSVFFGLLCVCMMMWSLLKRTQRHEKLRAICIHALARTITKMRNFSFNCILCARLSLIIFSLLNVVYAIFGGLME